MISLLSDTSQVRNSRELKALASGAEVSFSLVGDSGTIAVHISGSRIEVGRQSGRTVSEAASVGFELIAGDDVWEALLSPAPSPGLQSIIHLIRIGTIRIKGSNRVFNRHIHLVRAVIEALRGSTARKFLPQRHLHARGEYHRVTSDLGTADIHVERCGEGRPIVALATAGSSISQWHGVMTETSLTERYELITIDLPWHGMSSPTFDSALGEWQLTPDTYSTFIRDSVRAIALANPILLGVSMAGAAVVHAVAKYPREFAGAVACQAGQRVRQRSTPQLTETAIDQSLFVPEWTYGLMNPQSPAEFRKRVWWGYSSGGRGLYAADINSYQQWDFESIRNLLTVETPHIAVLSGAYDTSVPPEASRELAESIPNSSFRIMPDLGHFPHAENPAVFDRYLGPAIDRVLDSCP